MKYIKKNLLLIIVLQISHLTWCADQKSTPTDETSTVLAHAQTLFRQVATKQDIHTITDNNPLLKAILEYNHAAFDAAITTENIHHTNAKGQTALHILAYSTALKSTAAEKRAQFVLHATETLLAHGANPFEKDHNDQSFFSIMHGLAQCQKATQLAEKMLALLFLHTWFKSTRAETQQADA